MLAILTNLISADILRSRFSKAEGAFLLDFSYPDTCVFGTKCPLDHEECFSIFPDKQQKFVRCKVEGLFDSYPKIPTETVRWILRRNTVAQIKISRREWFYAKPNKTDPHRVLRQWSRTPADLKARQSEIWQLLKQSQKDEILRPKGTRRCKVSGNYFLAGSGRAKYCAACAAEVHRKQKAAHARKKRSGVDN